MAFTPPNFEPEKITAGVTASWTRSFPDYPASVWTLSYALVKMDPAGGAGQSIRFVAAASGDDFLVNVGPAVSQGYAPGDYKARAYVTDGVNRYQVWEGEFTIEADFAAAAPGDVRTHARKVLDAIEAVLEKRGTQQILEWTVEGVQLRRATVQDLMTLRDRYVTIVRKEEAMDRVRAGKASGRRILTRFVSPASSLGNWPPGFVRG